MVLQAEQSGGWETARSVADADLELVGYRDRAGHGLDMRVLPEPRVTLVLLLDGELHVQQPSGDRSPRAGIASGVGVSAARVRGRDVACVDIHLSPILAYSLFDRAIAELAGTVVSFEDLWAAKADQLRARLHRLDRWEDRFAALSSALHKGSDRQVHPEVAYTWRQLVATSGGRRVSDLAADTGWSRKRLWSRFTAQIGVTPKRAGRLVRLSTAVSELLAGTAAGEVAARRGYADQSHLTRELRELAGYTPAGLYEAWRAGAGTFVQDAAR